MIVQILFAWFREQSLASWILLSGLGNFFMAALSVAACALLGRSFPERRLFHAPQPLTLRDKWLAVLATILNTAVSVAGWLLWKAGWITITFPGWARTAFDAALLLFLMDAGMYGLHWMVHHRRLFPLIHRTHHTHEATNPLSLFVLNPCEVLGFGALLILALMLFPLSAYAIFIYLTLNLAFGTVGHAGVEPFPRRWLRLPLIRQVGTSTFHGLHHAEPEYNFGFYTIVWDRLLGTIHPEYDARMRGAAGLTGPID